MAHINSIEYHNVITKLRSFFEKRGFVEVHTQSRLSILAACEDPKTISTFEYNNEVWPLIQTNQMWLEYELLKNPALPGVFCISTSYRAESNPIPGRHDTIFPMFEFESKGSVADLYFLERQLLEYLGFGSKYCFPMGEYTEVAEKYSVTEFTSEHEEKLFQEFGPVYFLTKFPIHTLPFWNMKKDGNIANKIDVILCGIKTISSAELSTNPDEMRELFYTINNGMYSKILFEKFGKERVEKELEEFLSQDFFPRYGGGIRLTRMINALKLQNKE